MDELVERLSRGTHPVEVSLRPERTPQALQQQLGYGYVHIKFTGTKGGTELGVTLDRQASDLATADFAQGTGRATIVGSLVLNYVKVRCVAEIDLATLAGTGHLDVLTDAAAQETAAAHA